MPRHMDALFSQAYERELRGTERESFDTHLSTCAHCRDAYAHYQNSIAALRAMPRAPMPVAVHLPASDPLPAREAGGLVAALRALSARARLSAAAAALAIAGLGVITVAHGPASPSVASTAPAAGSGASVAQKNSIEAPDAASSAGCTPQTLASASSLPPAFGNVVTRSDPTRPAQTLTLATTSTTVTSGQTVLVYARLSASSPAAPGAADRGAASASQTLPCVMAVYSHSAPAPADAAPAGGGPAAQVPTSELLTQAAQPTMDITVAAQPLQAFTIPSGLPKGTTIQLVASVPGNYPNAGGGELQAVITLTVG